MVTQALYFQLINSNMNNRSLVELKIKASQFIQQYEQQETEREFQKQKLKQNVMLDILSNRNKTQSNSSNFRESRIGDLISRDEVNRLGNQRKQNCLYSEQRQLHSNPPSMLKQKQHSLSEGQNLRKDFPPEITFKANNKKETGYFVQPEKLTPQYQQAEDTSRNQYQSSNAGLDQMKIQEQMTFREQEKQLQGSQQNHWRDTIEEKPTQRYQRFKFKEPEIQAESHDSSHDSFRKSPNIDTKAKSFIKKYNHGQQKSQEQQERQQIEEVVERENKPGGVFLTVEENQSMQVTHEVPQKNMAFDIMMGKTQPIDNIEELRRKKIEQLDKKRQNRISQQKRLESLKKQEPPIQRNNLRTSSYSKKSQNKISEDPEPEPPKYSVNRRKVGDQQKKINISQNSIQESHYNVSNIGGRKGKIPYDNQSHESYQIVQTPHSVASESRAAKSRNKNTIFRQSPKRGQKSASKYSQQPKIQPKQRKNTFIKQSNKKLMINAVSNVCLPGELNRKDREKLIEVIENEPSQFFVFLFKEYSRKVIKAIYVLDHSQTFLHKIYGDRAPQQLVSENIKTFYRFDSGSRQFKKLDSCKSFSLVVHAVDLR